MFLGDSFYPPPLRLDSSDKSPDIVMLQGFLGTGYETFIDGHSEPIPNAELATWLLDSNS